MAAIAGVARELPLTLYATIIQFQKERLPFEPILVESNFGSYQPAVPGIVEGSFSNYHKERINHQLMEKLLQGA